MTCRALVVLLALVASACNQKVNNARHVDGIKTTVSATPGWVDRDALGRKLWTIECAFYEQRQHMPAWIDGDGTTPQLKDLIQQLHYSEKHGLDPARYRVAEFEQVREQSQQKMKGTVFPLEAVPELDAKMTYAYLRYAADPYGFDKAHARVRAAASL